MNQGDVKHRLASREDNRLKSWALRGGDASV